LEKRRGERLQGDKTFTAVIKKQSKDKLSIRGIKWISEEIRLHRRRSRVKLIIVLIKRKNVRSQRTCPGGVKK